MKRAILMVALLGVSGCAWFGGGGEDLDANRRFTPPAGGAAPSAEPARVTPSGVDQPGYIAPPGSAVKEQLPEGGRPAGAPGASAKPAAPVTTPLPVPGGEAVAPTSVVTEVTPATKPVEGVSSGSFMTLGGIVAEVNEHPIYANQVLRDIVGPLSARAKELDEGQFRRVARELIDKQLKARAASEARFAAAQRNLDEKDKETARLLTARWRQKQITDSGGSVEVAKKKWAAEGWDLEERSEEEYRATLTRFYYQKKIWPKVQVTAEEIRKYYQLHLDDQFTQRDEVHFRLIKIDPRRTGGREKALDKIKDLRTRAARGEDFAEMASGVNDDPYLMKRGGDVGWVQKGSFAIDVVEKAVWDLQVGQVSDIVDSGNAFYIAKVEERKLGRVMPFEEEAVQGKIAETLRKEQFNKLADKDLSDLNKNSVLRTDEDMLNTAIDMAMQDYPRWRAKA